MVASARPAQTADWQVHRQNEHVLLEQAEAALWSRPDDERLAHRVVALARRLGVLDVRRTFAARAGRVDYAGPAAYAQILWALGDVKAAAAAFAEARDVDPRGAAAWAGYARAMAAEHHPDDALGAYDQALARERRPSARKRLLEAELAIFDDAAPPTGDASAQNNARDRAIQIRRDLFELSPTSDAAAERLADALEAAGRSAEAAAALSAHLARAPSRAKLALRLRVIALRLADGDRADAEQAAGEMNALVETIPGRTSSARRQIWEAARAVARARGTMAALAEKLGRTPGTVELDVLGQIRDELGDLEAARAATRATFDREPRDAGIGRRLVSILERLGRNDDAAAVTADLARRVSTDPSLATARAEQLYRRGEIEDAAAAIDRALARFSHDPSALAALAETAARWNDHARTLAAWRRLRRIDRGNEAAIVGLGEAQFEAGHVAAARREWAALCTLSKHRSDGILRFGTTLADHDLYDDARDAARRAEAMSPKSPDPHRLLARIAEHERSFATAAAEWELVARLAPAGPAGRAQRREARTHALELAERQGRSRLNAHAQAIVAAARAQPDDAELALAAADAELRVGNTDGAETILRSVGERADHRGTSDEDRAEASLALAHLLKRTGRLDEAAARLREVARLSPGRAEEMAMQLAELARARYDVAGFRSATEAAESKADPPTLVRIGELRELFGDDQTAVDTYRRAIAAGASASATAALARILVRAGDTAAAAAALRTALATGRDEQLASEIGAQGLNFDEALGQLPILVEVLTRNPADGRPARQPTLVAALGRWLPAIYPNPSEDAARVRVGRRALRPMLDLITDPAWAPNAATVRLVGMLGDGDAAPAVAQVLAAALRLASGERRTGSAGAHVARAAAIALGRLSDPRARSALETAAGSELPDVRAAALWALGRTRTTLGASFWRRALDDRDPQTSALACLGLARAGDSATTTADVLVGIASNPGRDPLVRRAAIVGLGLGRRLSRGATAALLGLLDSGDPALARAASRALGWTNDRAAVQPLIARAFLSGLYALPNGDDARAALDAWTSRQEPPDEARWLTSDNVDASAVLEALEASPSATDLSDFVRAHVTDVAVVFGAALDQPGEPRRLALAALENWPERAAASGPVASDHAPTSTENTAWPRELVAALADRLAALLDGDDAADRTASLRVLADADDERITPARIAEVAADPAAAPDSAREIAERVLRSRPSLAPAIAAALAAPVSDLTSPFAWRRRFAAVRALAALGESGEPLLERAARDPHPVVRAAAVDALASLRPSPA
jgi:Flp pilus assembly protein TadD